jgi:hypothetical protein
MRIDSTAIDNIPKGSDGFPDPLASQKVRSEAAYSAAYIKAAWGRQGGYWNINNPSGNFTTYFTMDRLYAIGAQPAAPYVAQYSLAKGDTSIDGGGDTPGGWNRGGEGSFLLSSSTEILPVVNQFMAQLLAKFDEHPTTPQVRANDPLSRHEADEFRYRQLAEIRNEKANKGFYASMGVDYERKGKPKTPQQLDMLLKAGGFKPAIALLLEKLGLESLAQVRYDDKVRREIITNDWIPCGIGACYTGMRAGGDLICKRILPETLLLPWTDRADATDVPWIGYFEDMTVSEVVREAGDWLKRDEQEELQKGETGLNPLGNAGWGTGRTGRVRVVRFYFVGLHEINYKVSGKEGNKYTPIEDKSLLDDKDAANPRASSQTLGVYGGCWAVGTDIFWSTGYQPNQRCISPGNPILPIEVFVHQNSGAGTHRSIIRRLKPILDELQKSFLRMQHIAAHNGIPILAYSKKALAWAAGADGVNMDEYFKAVRASGLVGVEDTDEIYQGDKQPLWLLDVNNVTNAAQTESANFYFWIDQLQRALGFSDINSGGQVSDRKGKAVSEMQAANTVNALYDITSGITSFGVGVTRSLIGLSITGCVNPHTEKYWRRVIGDDDVEAVKLLAVNSVGGNSTVLEDAGISVIPYPKASEIQAIQVQLQIALTGRDGKAPMVTMDEAMTVQDYLSSGRTLMARYYLQVCAQNRREEQAEQEQSMMQQQQQMQAQAEDMRAQAMQMQQQIKTQGDLEKIQANTEGNLAKIDAQGQVQAMLDQARSMDMLGMNMQLSVQNAQQQKELESLKSKLALVEEERTIRLQAEEDRKTQAEAPKPVPGAKK